MVCATCNAPNEPGALYCERCGNRVALAAGAAVGSTQAAAFDPRIRGGAAPSPSKGYAQDKAPLLAALLSLIWPGIGQLYNGDTKRGLIMFLLSLFFAVLVAIPVLGVPLTIGIRVWAVINAFRVASRQVPLS